MILQQRGLNGLRGLGEFDTWYGDGWTEYDDSYYADYGGGQVITFDDGSTITVNADGSYGSTPMTDLPVEVIPAGQVPPTLTIDPGKIIRAGADLYRYVQQTNAQGQRVYVPQRYATMPGQRQPSWLIPAAIAAAAFLLA